MNIVGVQKYVITSIDIDISLDVWAFLVQY